MSKHTPGPWLYNSYNAIISKPLSDEYMRMEAELDARLKVEGREETTDADWEGFPETCVATVPASHGDTATGRHRADARLIAAAPLLRSELADLLNVLDALSVTMPILNTSAALTAARESGRRVIAEAEGSER